MARQSVLITNKKPKAKKTNRTKHKEMQAKENQLRVHKPEYLNNALQQKFHDRERAIQLYVKARQAVAGIETDIAWSACPWQLGQMVTYSELDIDDKPMATKAIISRIAFNPENPFYTVYIRTLDHKGFITSKHIKIEHIRTIMGSMTSPPVENLPSLIATGIVKLEDFIDPEDPDFSRRIFSSYHRGQALVRISPQVEELLRTSLAKDYLRKK